MNSTFFKSEDYDRYLESDFRYRWLRPELLYSKLNDVKAIDNFNKIEAGKSVQGRPIYALKYGKGPIKVVLWTQMHGNEPTATMALVDLLNFLSADDEYNLLRKEISDNLQITMFPMLNPDGAERFTRRNALDVDLNREAAKNSMPELEVLLGWVRENQPDWAFNLHDQRNIFTVGDSANSATISFLAASADVKKSKTATREKSMSLIGELSDVVEKHLPGHVGKYTDEFYPRALGEYFHKSNIPCVLIESGAYQNDPYRDNARKMNFLCLVESLALIAKDRIPQAGTSKYDSIPENTTNMMDVIIRNCTIKLGGSTYTTDIGMLYKEVPDFETGKLLLKLSVSDIGDLQFHHAFKEIQGGIIEGDKYRPEFEKLANFEILQKDGTVIKFENGVLV